MPPITKYAEGQPQPWVSHAMKGVKTTGAAYCEELKIAEAVARSAAGNQVATTRPLVG